MAQRPANTTPEISTERRLTVIIRVTLLSALTTLGCLAVVAFTITHWLENHVLDPDAWVATVAPLPQHTVVNDALSSYITGLVFTNVNVEQEIQNVLPPKAAFIAGPLSDQLRTLTTKVSKRVIASDNFRTIWEAANRLAMTRLVANARSPNPPSGSKLNQVFNVDLSGIRTTLADKLGTSANALPALQPQSHRKFAIGANLQTKRERLWQYIRTADLLEVVLPSVVGAAFLGALALARDRRRTLLVIALTTIVLLLLEQISLKALRQSVLDQVKHAEYRQAVGYIYDTITAALRSFVFTLLIPCVLIVVACVLASPAKWAVALRQQVGHTLSFLRPVVHYWHLVRERTQQYRFVIWGVIAMLLLIWLAFIAQIDARTVIRDVLIAISLTELVYIIAQPRPHTTV